MSGARVGDGSATARRGVAMVLLCGAQLLLLLDFSIVNLALPDMRGSLGFSTSGVQWVASAYAVTFGGFLLLGGRLVDLLGGRRLLVTGLAVFGLASLAGGCAPVPEVLVAMRAVQGVGAAMVAPAVLALITTTFPEGPHRNRMIGWFVAASASGFGLGVLLGGVLTDGFGWRAVLLVNVPLVVAAVVAAFQVLGAPGERVERPRAEVFGAVPGIAGLILVIYGCTVLAGGETATSAAVLVALGCLGVGVFLAVDRRLRRPLLPLQVFRLRNVGAVNALGLLGNGTFGASTSLLSLQLQDATGLTPLAAGLFFVPFGVGVALSATSTSRLVARYGAKRALVGGAAVMAVGTALLMRASAANGTWDALLPGMLLVAVGGGAFYTAVTIIGTAGVPDRQQGLASGLLNMTTQLGTALCVAVLVTVAGAGGGSGAVVTTSGTAAAFGVATAVVAAVAVLAALTVRTPHPAR
ncbi:MFS transporter [Saccharothrix sp. BKS2]|uniref:MFS transporter n=1 Tax=Saccharothrix sp. BKS2 TaxID=3064400 RepID=UPI0039ED21BF